MSGQDDTPTEPMLTLGGPGIRVGSNENELYLRRMRRGHVAAMVSLAVSTAYYRRHNDDRRTRLLEIEDAILRLKARAVEKDIKP